MAQIGIRKTIIKKRQTAYHAHKEKPTAKKTILGWISIPAKYIDRTVRNKENQNMFKNFLGNVGEGATRFSEAQHKRKTTKRKSTRR